MTDFFPGRQNGPKWPNMAKKGQKKNREKNVQKYFSKVGGMGPLARFPHAGEQDDGSLHKLPQTNSFQLSSSSLPRLGPPADGPMPGCGKEGRRGGREEGLELCLI